jgi:hypothetical protein
MRGVLVLANHTGWSLAEITDLAIEDFVEWVTKIPSRK